MKKIRSTWIIALAIILLGYVDTQAQEHQATVTSQGGGTSEGGSYTQFSVVGGEIVNTSMLGGSYEGQAGFLFRTFDGFVPRYDISGNVIIPEGDPLAAGVVALLQDVSGTKTQVASISLDKTGNFAFPKVKQGTYTLKIIPSSTDQNPLPLLTTYLGGVQLPKDATLIALAKNEVFANITVLREQAPDQEWVGTSSMNGVLVKDDGSSGNAGGRLMTGLRTNAGTPMVNAQVFLTEPTSGTIKFSALTNSEGKFAFENIAPREYGFLVEYQGETFAMTEKISVTKDNSTVEVTAVISGNSVNASVKQVTGLEEPLVVDFLLYPNPVQNQVNIYISGLSPGAVKLTVHDRQGKILLTKGGQTREGQLQETLDLSGLPQGLYLISVGQHAKFIHRKVVKE